MKYLNTGQVIDGLMTLKKVGSCQGPNGTYEIYQDGKCQMVVKSLHSGRKFMLTWQDVVGIAVDNGVDDRVLSGLALS